MPAAVDISSSPYDNFNRPANTGQGNPVDMSNVGAVNTARGQNYEGRASEAYKTGVERGDSIWNLGQDISKSALDTSRTFNDWAVRDRATYDSTVAPAMRDQMDFARNYGSEANRAQKRGQAMAQTGITFDAAADMARRSLQSYGVDPSAGRYVGLDAGLAASRAKAQALAGTNADQAAEVMGQEYLDRAIQRGMVLPGQAANEAGVALAANNQAVNTGVAAGDAQNRLRQPSGWVDASQKALDKYQEGLVQQTSLGLQQNRDKAQIDLALEKLKQESSSGTGAALGMGLGILGKLAGSYFGAGGSLGSMFGGDAISNVSQGGYTGGQAMDMFSGAARRGGPIRKRLPAYRAGGMVRNPKEELDPFDPYEHRDADFTDDYMYEGRPTVDSDSGDEWDDDPESPLQRLPDRRYEDGGAVEGDDIDYAGVFRQPRFAEGGRVGKRSVQEMLDDYREPWDPEGEGYDRRGADWTGLGPEWNDNPAQGEPGMRGFGRDPATGRQLKGRRHPTFDHGIEIDRKMGGGLEKQNGHYYTQPFQRYAEGGDVEDEFVDTPPEEEMGGEPTPGVGEPPIQGNMVPPEASPSGGEETDDVHALVNEGEFIFPKEVTRWYGEKYLQNMIKKAHDEMAGPDLAQPEPAAPTQAMAIAPPSFQSSGA